MIDLRLLGAGGMMPLPDRWLSSVLIRVGGDLILFDCGEGTQIPWQVSGWGFRRLRTVCLSHLHADHIGGLPGVLYAVANANREEPVTIIGPPGTGRVVEAIQVIAPISGYEVRVLEIDEGAQFDLTGSISARVMRGDHHVPSLAYRFDVPRGRRFLVEQAERDGIPVEYWSALQSGQDVAQQGTRYSAATYLGPKRRGLSVGIVTDTRPVAGFGEFLNGVDLLISEGTYGDPDDARKAVDNKHMTFEEAATIAREAQAGRLWLTHFSPSIADPAAYLHHATKIFPETTVGYSGLERTLSFPDEE